MQLPRRLLAGAVILVGAPAPARTPPALPFAIATVHFEQNATDKDFEVVFEVKGNGEGLAQLVVTAPDGRKVIDFTAPDGSTLGMRQFRFESPESDAEAAIKAAYPEGTYAFSGLTTSGAQLEGRSTLRHALPPTATLRRPTAGAAGVSTEGLEIAWTPVPNLAAYVLYIEQDEPEYSITARLAPTATSFAVPRGFLVAGTEYVLGIGTVTAEGNISYIENTFTTAE